MLLAECAAGGVQRRQPCAVRALRRAGDGFELDTDAGTLRAAAGGRHRRALHPQDRRERFRLSAGRAVRPPRRGDAPGLVPLTFAAADWAPFVPLAGISLEVGIETGVARHAGASSKTCSSPTAASPARPCCRPRTTGARASRCAWIWPTATTWPLNCWPPSRAHAASSAPNWPSRLPRRLAEAWLAARPGWAARPLAEMRDAELRELAATSLQACRQITPDGSEGYRKAEVTLGGVTPASSTSRPWRAACSRACISSARWSTSPAGSAVTTSSGPGPARPALRPGPGAWRIGARRSARIPTYNRCLCWQTRAAIAAAERDRNSGPPVSHEQQHRAQLNPPFYMTTIRVKENEPFDVALRRFKRTIENSGC